MKDIFSILRYPPKGQANSILCAITKSSGSSPRKKGSLMLVGEKGRLAGSVGGGAIEFEVENQALALLASNTRYFMKEYVLSRSGGIDMVCGGNITVLFTLLKAAEPEVAMLTETVLTALEKKQPGTLSFFYGSLPLLNASAESASRSELILPLPIGERAVLFGGGHVSAALCPLLAGIGFHVTVIDCRQEYASEERFPTAEKVICAPYENISSVLSLTPEDYIVIMTNGHIYDLAVEEQILRLDTAYVGVIGSRGKITTVHGKLREAGICEEKLSFVHTPIGVPIKAVTPEEIAISIAAEMILVRACRREASGNTASHGCPMQRD